MKSPNEALIEFLIKKDELLKEYDPDIYKNSPYILPEDIEEVKGWSEDDCIKVIKNMSNEDDTQFCPWCILNKELMQRGDQKGYKCDFCEYGKRHGLCTDMESTYDTWTKVGNPSIIDRLQNYSDEMLDKLRRTSGIGG